MRVGLWTRLMNPRRASALRVAIAVHEPMMVTYSVLLPHIAAPDTQESNPALQTRIECVGLYLHWLSRYAQATDRESVLNDSIQDALDHLAHAIAKLPDDSQFGIFFEYFVERMNTAENAYAEEARKRPANELLATIANTFYYRVARFLSFGLDERHQGHDLVVRTALEQIVRSKFEKAF